MKNQTSAILAARTKRRRNSAITDTFQLLILGGGIIWLLLRGAAEMNYVWQWHRVPQYIYKVIDGELIFGPLIDGLMVTLEIGVYSIVLGLVIGLVTAFLRLSDSYSGRLLATVYLELVRNTPLLIQLFVFYFVLGPIFEIDRFWVAVLCISFFEGSFAAEIIRGGILSVPKGQVEAGASLGLSRAATYRYITLPQALPIILPPLAGILVNLIKHSAIVSVIAVFDLTTSGLDIISETFMAFEIWITVASMYLVITISLSIVISRFERYMKRSTLAG
tara:strand:+ start:18 stop:848 length:831 start_codon:yes stop_codon:yes gene_type:complete